MVRNCYNSQLVQTKVTRVSDSEDDGGGGASSGVLKMKTVSLATVTAGCHKVCKCLDAGLSDDSDR